MDGACFQLPELVQVFQAWCIHWVMSTGDVFGQKGTACSAHEVTVLKNIEVDCRVSPPTLHSLRFYDPVMFPLMMEVK